MTTPVNEELDWFTVFRTAENDGWLYRELTEGRLRQGWGASGLGLMNADGPVDKTHWEAAHRRLPGKGNPTPKRFAILRRMLDMERGSIAVVPKMPEWNQLTIALVSGDYRFEVDDDRDELGHIAPVDPDSLRTMCFLLGIADRYREDWA